MSHRLFTFEKDPDQRWYIVLPEWTGNRADLEMVQGADKMLDIAAEGENRVQLTLSTKPFDNADELTWIEDFKDPEIGGAVYNMPKWKGVDYNLKMWLCDVTKFVFGDFPKTIYIF